MGIYAKATTLQIMQQTISYEKGLTISTTLSGYIRLLDLYNYSCPNDCLKQQNKQKGLWLNFT